MKKIFKISEIRNLQRLVDRGEISYSRMIELLNQKAYDTYSNQTVTLREYDEDFTDVDCDYFEFQQMPDDADEVCHLGIGIENCAHCYKNRALHVR